MPLSPTRSPRKPRRRDRDAGHAQRPRRTAAERAQRAGGPQDFALYTCSCGYVFTAPVSSSVDCPHCGGEQAW